MPAYPLEIIAIVFIFGLCIGSFLNVCIYRIPASKSIVSPPSACPACGYQLRFYDNIPVLSYLFLRGKCRKCGISISPRYPIVELLTGLFATGVFLKFGMTPETPVYFFFIATLLAITFIDIDHQIIPDIISLPGIPVFFLAAFALPSVTWQAALIGILVGGGVLYAIAWVYHFITGKDGMGGGDIKLLAMIGALLGWKGVLFTIFVSSAVGTIVGVTVMLYTRKNMKLAIPYGPFLAIGAITYIFSGPRIIDWYLNVARSSPF
ncbi:prepilin peptidase [Desulfonema ishimotonii]|uniref:Prepilin leader peptidase/N-methyltransferase n=1 Tax=Desulfonema ishimotonii TaxID=45657 RepID=A0A401FRP0_9BACT|nr:A24 family peptidase [Desulfonema ishimotonii]GBC59620.1 prepilin peptidase [Desulfonema ishimotonii]